MEAIEAIEAVEAIQSVEVAPRDAGVSLAA